MLTRVLKEALVDLHVLDHFAVGNNRAASMAERGARLSAARGCRCLFLFLLPPSTLRSSGP